MIEIYYFLYCFFALANFFGMMIASPHENSWAEQLVMVMLSVLWPITALSCLFALIYGAKAK